MSGRKAKASIGPRRIARPLRLSDDVLQSLAKDIHSGRLAAGDRLPSEVELAESFGVSRTVIREAISYLKADGLVISRQGLGVFVTSESDTNRPFRLEQRDSVSTKVVREIFELRIGVEAEAAALAAKRRNRSEVAELRGALDKIAKSKDGPDVGVSADVEFHRCIAKISKNTQISKFLNFLESYLVEAIRLARQNSARHIGLTEVVQNEHQAIFEAIADGDPSAAHAAIRNHLQNAQKRLNLI